jgi:hypothetical protein
VLDAAACFLPPLDAALFEPAEDLSFSEAIEVLDDLRVADIGRKERSLKKENFEKLLKRKIYTANNRLY